MRACSAGIGSTRADAVGVKRCGADVSTTRFIGRSAVKHAA